MQVSSVNKVSFGSRITGNYPEIEEISRKAGYPEKHIGGINNRLHAIFPGEADELNFVYKKEIVCPRVDGGPFYQDGVTGIGKHIRIKEQPYMVTEKRISLLRGGKVIASEPVRSIAMPPKMFEVLRLKYEGIGVKAAAVYEAELAALRARRLLLEYFLAAIRIARRVKK